MEVVGAELIPCALMVAATNLRFFFRILTNENINQRIMIASVFTRYSKWRLK